MLHKTITSGKGIMKMQEVQEKARMLGLNPGKMKKADLIHAIQSKEGNFPCFGTAKDFCDQTECCWRSDCLPEKSAGKMEISERGAYLEKVKAELEEFNKKIGDLKEKAKKKVGKAKTEALEEIKMLEKKSEEGIKLKMHKLAEASEDVWKTTKKGIDNSWKDLRAAVKKTMSKHSKVKK